MFVLIYLLLGLMLVIGIDMGARIERENDFGNLQPSVAPVVVVLWPLVLYWGVLEIRGTRRSKS